MNYAEIAKSLFEWNAKNLVATAHVKKSDISNYFASAFKVVANGREYEANYDNYFEFLNEFRSTIRKISYEFSDFIVDKRSVAISLQAQIIRTDDRIENFMAILILKFNENNKIIFWHEVYVKT